MLHWLFLVVTILLVFALLSYLFFWNRIIGFLITLTLRIIYWNQGGSSIWVELGSVHFSLLAGRVLFKNVCYHSSNQTINIVKGQISWRYWIRFPAFEEGLFSSVTGESHADQKPRPSSCRIQASIEGFEWFLYNRTPAFDSIISAAKDTPSQPRRHTRSQSTERMSSEPVLTKAPSGAESPLFSPLARSATIGVTAPRLLRSILDWFTNQLPNLDPKSLLPVGFEGTKGAILCGNGSTHSILVAEFNHAIGTFGIIPARSRYDLYKQTLKIIFDDASIRLADNDQYLGPMAYTGAELHDNIGSFFHGIHDLSFHSFMRLWKSATVENVLRGFQQSVKSRRVASAPSSSFRMRKKAKTVDRASDVNSSEAEYAVERKVLEAPSLELSYYADVPGLVPVDQRMLECEGWDIGNGDFEPEWGIDVVVHGGFIKYGPWADRQRTELQQVFFPPSYRDTQPTTSLKPGDRRMWTALHIFVELRNGTTLYMPFREVSKDWLWDGQTEMPRPKKREPASFSIRAGDDSTIRYTMPIVAGVQGFNPLLDIHLGSAAVSSSLNDIRLLTTESCRINCKPSSPLKWKDNRTWLFAVTLCQPVFYLLRDHINMLADLGKDWTSGPASNYLIWASTEYVINFDMQNYEVNTYVNDHNIIDKPLIRDENALLTIAGALLRCEVLIPIQNFRPVSTTIAFLVDAPDVKLHLTLPRWNTHSPQATEPTTHLSSIGVIRLKGSYRYFSQVREDNIEQLKLNVHSRDAVFKCLGWSIRHFMVFRDNYFGNFTQFSTLEEYLQKRRKGQPVGDPIDQKYRPGKANHLQVELNLNLDRTLLYFPAGIPGYETYNPLPNQGPQDVDLGACAVLGMQDFQLQLRSHDYLMEMSLNIGLAHVNTQPSCTERSVFENSSWSFDEKLVVDGLDIVAHRLLGPRPRTSTYVCVWEIAVGQIRGLLSIAEARVLRAVFNAFLVNYHDALNAPAAEFALPTEPDVTFLDVNVLSLDIGFSAALVAIQTRLPQGLQFKSNNLAGNHYRRVTSIKAPNIMVQCLQKSDGRCWMELGSYEMDLALDIYARPPEWLQSSVEQAEFINAQDAPTCRARSLFSDMKRSNLGGLWMTDLRLPHKRIQGGMNRGFGASIHPDEELGHGKSMPVSHGQRNTSDSDSENDYLNIDRGPGPVHSRPVSLLPLQRKKGAPLCGNESETTELSDEPHNWKDQDQSDASLYAKCTRHYTLQKPRKPSLWSGSPFVLLQAPASSHIHVQTEQHRLHSEDNSHGQDLVQGPPEEDDVVCARLITRSVRIGATPMVPSAIVQLFESSAESSMSSELRLDAAMADHIQVFSEPYGQDRTFIIDSEICSLHLQSFQLLDPSHSADRDAQQQMTTVDVRANGLRFTGKLADASQRSASFSLTHLWLALCPMHLHSGLHRINPVFIAAVTDANASAISRQLSISWDSLDIDLCHSAPRYVVGTVTCFVAAVVNASQSHRQASHHNLLRAQWRVRQVLQWSGEHSVVYPLSTIQPSYLIQTGQPHELRDDTTFKVLFYLRNCLRFLGPAERQALRCAEPDSHAPISPEEIANLLEDQISNLAADADITLLSEDSILSKLFPAGLAKPLGASSQRLHSLSLNFGRFQTHIWDASHTTSSLILLESFKLSLLSHKHELILSAAMKKDLTGVRDKARQKFDRIVLSVSAGKIEVLVVPQILYFAQDFLAADQFLRHYAVWTTFSHSASASDLSAMVHPTHLDVSVLIQDLLIRVAAEKLLIDFNVGGARGILSTLGRGQPLVQSLQDSPASLFCRAHTVSFRAYGLPVKGLENGQDELASVVLHHIRFHSVVRQEVVLSTTARSVLAAETLVLEVSRSAIRLWRFVEEWRSEFVPAVEVAIRILMPDAKSSSPISSNDLPVNHPQKKSPIIHFQASLRSFQTRLRIMSGTWLYWEMVDIIMYLRFTVSSSRKLSRSLGCQWAAQTADIYSSNGEAGLPLVEQLHMDLPSLTLTGKYESRGIDALVSVGLFHVTVKPSYWDTLLSVQQKFGQDFNDLILFIGRAQTNRPSSSKTIHATSLHSGLLKMKGFRVGLEGHSSTSYLECQDINGGFGSDGGFWYINITGLALSLAPHTQRSPAIITFSGNHRSAFVIIDCQMKVDNRSLEKKTVNVGVTKIHAVMQPSSIGEIGDFLDHLQAEVLLREEERARELEGFKEKTKRLMQTFEVKSKDRNGDDAMSWLADYAITFTVKNIGAAFPLAFGHGFEHARVKSDGHGAVRAFLFSIRSLTFGTERGVGRAVMQRFSFQFVDRFRQSTPADFSGENHESKNRLIYPEMTAWLRSDRSSKSRRLRVGANVSGFILHLDPSIPDHIFSLVDVYRQGKERVDKLTANYPRHMNDLRPTAASEDGGTKSLPTSHALVSLIFYSGHVHLHHDSPFERTNTVHRHAHGQTSGQNTETFNLPMVSVWGEFRAAPGSWKRTNTKKRVASHLAFKSTVHSSENTLRPTLLPFVSELVNRIEKRMKKTGRGPLTYDSTPAVSVEPRLEPSSSIEITFALRIDQSKLRLTCQPDVNVLAGIYWNSGGFVINISPGARQMSFMGNVGGLSIGIKHGFLSEDCIRLDARDLVFAVTFTKTAQDQERSVGSVSIVLDTEVSGGVHFSRLQDVLCFKAVWLDHIPILNSTSAASFVEADTTSLVPSANINIPKQTLVNALLIRVRRIELDVDLGQSISAIKLDLQNVSLRTRLGEVSDEFYFGIVEFNVDAIGNISGKAHVPNFAFQSHRRKDILASSVVPSSAPVTMLDLSMTSGAIDIRVDSDYQRILQISAGPLRVVIYDDWSELSSGIVKSNQCLRLSFSVSGSNLTTIATVGTIPKLVSYVSKFKSNLDIQREGASRESQTFRVARSPNPDNPLSSVAQAMIQSARARLREPEAPLTYVIRQEMRMSLQSIRLVVFPRTMLDIEVAHFAARDVRAQLDRILRSESLPVQRTLHLAFASMTTSKYSQLNQSSIQPSFDRGFEEKSDLNDLLQNASEATIFDLPSMDMLMKSEEMGKESGTVLKYDFISRFVRMEGLKDQEDIYITLNVSLYSWLTILRKNLTRELNQVQGGMDRRPVVGTTATSPTSRKKASDSLYAELAPDIVSGVPSRPDTPLDSGSLPADVYPPSAYSAAVPENMNASSNLDNVAVSPVLSSPDTEEHNFGQVSALHDAQQPIGSTSSTSSANGPPKPSGIVYLAGERRIERLNMRQLGEATPDVMHPFFMKKAGFSLEDSLPQYVHEYATLPIDEITRLLLNLYSKQLRDDHT